MQCVVIQHVESVRRKCFGGLAKLRQGILYWQALIEEHWYYHTWIIIQSYIWQDKELQDRVEESSERYEANSGKATTVKVTD